MVGSCFSLIVSLLVLFVFVAFGFPQRGNGDEGGEDAKQCLEVSRTTFANLTLRACSRKGPFSNCTIRYRRRCVNSTELRCRSVDREVCTVRQGVKCTERVSDDADTPELISCISNEVMNKTTEKNVLTPERSFFKSAPDCKLEPREVCLNETTRTCGERVASDFVCMNTTAEEEVCTEKVERVPTGRTRRTLCEGDDGYEEALAEEVEKAEADKKEEEDTVSSTSGEVTKGEEANTDT